MKIKILLITAFSSFYPIHAMSETRKEKCDFIRINHIFGENNPTPIKKTSMPMLNLTKKIILQEQSLYYQGSDQGKVQFPYSLRKFTDILQNLDSFEENQVLPIPLSIDQKYLDIITKILIGANKNILPTDSEEEKQEKIKNEGFIAIYMLSVPEKITFLEIVNFLGIPGISLELIRSLSKQGWQLKEQLYKHNPETNDDELVVSDYTLYFIIETIKKYFIQFADKLKWGTETQKTIASQIKTLDQAIFVSMFVNFFLINGKADLTTFLNQNPNAIKIFETFPVETQEILKTTKSNRTIYQTRRLQI